MLPGGGEACFLVETARWLPACEAGGIDSSRALGSKKFKESLTLSFRRGPFPFCGFVESLREVELAAKAESVGFAKLTDTDCGGFEACSFEADAVERGEMVEALHDHDHEWGDVFAHGGVALREGQVARSQVGVGERRSRHRERRGCPGRCGHRGGSCLRWDGWAYPMRVGQRALELLIREDLLP